MLISKRLEEQIVCSKKIHSNICADQIIIAQSFGEKRFKCGICLTKIKTWQLIFNCRLTINQIQAIEDQIYLRLSQDVFEYVSNLELFWNNIISNRSEDEQQKLTHYIKQWIIYLIDIAEEYSVYSFQNEAEEFCKCVQKITDVRTTDVVWDLFVSKKKIKLIKIVNQCNSFFFNKLQSIMNHAQIQDDYLKKPYAGFENLACYSQNKVSRLNELKYEYLKRIKVPQKQNIQSILNCYKKNYDMMLQKIKIFNILLESNKDGNLLNFNFFQVGFLMEIIIKAQQKIQIQQTEQNFKQTEGCLSISFNYNDQLMAAGCGSNIKLYRFENGKIVNPINEFQGHIDFIFCLSFSKIHNWLISGGKDGKIFLWKENDQNDWESVEIDLQNPIYCLILSKNEEQLISGNSVGQIHIFKIKYQQNTIKNQQIIQIHKTSIISMSINDSGTQFGICTLDNQIILFANVMENQWEQFQVLNSNKKNTFLKLIFINNDTIICQSFKEQTLIIFIYHNNYFKEESSIIIEGSLEFCLNPLIYNKRTQILLVKQNKQIYLIKHDDKQFILSNHKIIINNDRYFVSASQNGKSIVLWEIQQQTFQIYDLISQV